MQIHHHKTVSTGPPKLPPIDQDASKQWPETLQICRQNHGCFAPKISSSPERPEALERPSPAAPSSSHYSLWPWLADLQGPPHQVLAVPAPTCSLELDAEALLNTEFGFVTARLFSLFFIHLPLQGCCNGFDPFLARAKWVCGLLDRLRPLVEARRAWLGPEHQPA